MIVGEDGTRTIMKKTLACLVLSLGLHLVLLVVIAALWPPVRWSGSGADVHTIESVEVDGDRAPGPASKAVDEPAGAREAPAPRPRPARPPEPPRAGPAMDETAVEPEMATEDPRFTSNPFKLSYPVLAQTLGPLHPGQEKQGVDGMLEEYFSDLAAYKAVKHGEYDLALLDLRDRMEDMWHPVFGQIHESPLGSAAGKWIEDWRKSAETYGKTGSPVDDPPTNKFYGDVEPEDLGILDTYEQLEKADVFTTRARLVVAVSFDGKGGWKVSKVQGSGYSSVDEAALEAVEEALEANPDLVPEYETLTRWALEADFSVAPPLPVAGFSFDLALGHFEAVYPLKKRVSRRIKLLAVKVPKQG